MEMPSAHKFDRIIITINIYIIFYCNEKIEL